MRKKTLKRRIWIVFTLYGVSILLLNVLPLNLSEKLNNTYFWEFRADYITHGLIFLPWCLFQCLFGKKQKIAWFIFGVVISIIMEIVQYFLPYRSFNMYDMLFNFIGLIIGYIIFAGLNFKIEDYFLAKHSSHRKK